jgi:hypothetical protein
LGDTNNKLTPKIIDKKEEKINELENEKKKIIENHLKFEKSLEKGETEEELLIRTGMITPFDSTKKRKKKEVETKRKKKKKNPHEDQEVEEEIIQFEGDFVISSKIYDKLFDYQKTGFNTTFNSPKGSDGCQNFIHRMLEELLGMKW